MNIYVCKIPSYQNWREVLYYSRYISQQRQDRIQRYKKVGDAYRSLTSELLLRKILLDHFQLDDVAISINKQGKPYLPYHSDIHFNLSHSGEWCVCTVGEKQVGIDIEYIGVIPENMIFTIISDEELESEDDLQHLFYEKWTVLESYLKMIGTGLYLPLDSVEMSAEGDQTYNVKHCEGAYPEGTTKCVTFKENYKLSVCTHGLDDNLQTCIYQYEFDWLVT
ncbi:4'-phosphopantetheinyl transferase family protein [Oceanobacillus sp. 1P07AA]|uniref:4'-phosphopantetheinyl transferase family protein n=1 Tax=Oceanobacillus sp. 1P07AA TaxID=3132293 RepID=UPI0039A41AC4